MRSKFTAEQVSHWNKFKAELNSAGNTITCNVQQKKETIRRFFMLNGMQTNGKISIILLYRAWLLMHVSAGFIFESTDFTMIVFSTGNLYQKLIGERSCSKHKAKPSVLEHLHCHKRRKEIRFSGIKCRGLVFQVGVGRKADDLAL